MLHFLFINESLLHYLSVLFTTMFCVCVNESVHLLLLVYRLQYFAIPGLNI